METPKTLMLEMFEMAVESGQIARAEGLLSVMTLKDRAIAALSLLSAKVDFGGAA